jgi:hypothetical protein
MCIRFSLRLVGRICERIAPPTGRGIQVLRFHKQGPEMKEDSKNVNVFVVDTAFQLLNAIEAVNSLELSNNHLIIVEDAGRRRKEFETMIKSTDWVRVTYVSLDLGWRDVRIFGPINEIVQRWYGRYLHFRRMRRLDRLIKSLGEVNNLFLGHYWVDYKYFMRHFANKIKHKALYLLDDGTDTIDINNHRKLIDRIKCENASILIADGNPLLNWIEMYVRRKYWNWDVREAESVTFFTTYNLDIRDGDHLVKNEYHYLRSLALESTPTDEVLFVGQDLVETGDIEEEKLLEYLKKVKDYFEGDKIKYVPHPMDSLRIIEKIRDCLGFEIKQFGVPIEYAIVVGGHIPKVLASFCSSALESCSNILGDRVKIVAFYLYPEHLMRWRDNIEGIYEYYEKKTKRNFAVIKLVICERQVPHLTESMSGSTERGNINV